MIASFTKALVPLSPGCVTQDLQVERRGDVVPSAESLQPLELVHDLKQLPVDRRLPYDGNQNILKARQCCEVLA
jgi:hypothetical protein